MIGLMRDPHRCHGFAIVTLCHGQIRVYSNNSFKDRDFYAFTAVEPQEFPFLQPRCEVGSPANFRTEGKELLRGWGAYPPKEVFEFLKTEFNIEFGVERRFVERLVALTRMQQTEFMRKSPFPLKPYNTLQDTNPVL